MDVTEPVVGTAAGPVRGRAQDDVAVFRGIPFAQPPVGDLRFAAPRPARPWDGVREAAAFGPPPPQSAFLLTPISRAAPGTDPDNWLTVNVFSPGLGAAGLPVMVWIYGGAYRSGASSLPGYDGSPLARQNVVVVTFNHRIGVEGYAYLPGVPANRALLDQVAAQVAHTSVPFSPVVDGEVLPAAPWRAVAAGAARDVDLLTGHNRDEHRLFTNLSGQRGKITDEAASRALRGLADGEAGEAAYHEAYPDADAETLFELVNSDWLFRMPTLHLAQAHAAAGGRTFLYQLSYPAPEGDFGACHAIDVPLVFGVYQGIGRMLFGPEPPASAVALGDLMRSQWAAFAARGDPGWPPYAPGRRTTRIFDDPPDVVPYPEAASLHLWDQHRFGVLDLSPGPA